VAKAAVALRDERAAIQARHNLTLRDLYRTLDKPGANPMKILQDKLDEAVRLAYGMPDSADAITFLFELNQAMAAKEAAGEAVAGPGLPPSITDPAAFITTDCVKA
jgi:hypothetical protein